MAGNVSINDGVAARTYKPLGPDKDGVFWYEDSSRSDYAIGYYRFSIQVKRPPVAAAGQASTGRTYRVVIGFHTPILENTSNSTIVGVPPAPTVSYIPRVFVEFVMPERSTEGNRETLKILLQNLLADVVALNAIKSLTPPF